jgi:hypothetical protein
VAQNYYNGDLDVGISGNLISAVSMLDWTGYSMLHIHTLCQY